MMKSKSLIAVLFCCALFVCKPVKAFWPIFDLTEIAPVFSQVSTVTESLKNLKEQLTEQINTLRALGSSIEGLGAFAKDISEKVSKAASTIKNAVNDVKDKINDVKNIGKDVLNAVDDVQNAYKEAVVTAKNSTNFIAGVSSDRKDSTERDKPSVSTDNIKKELPKVDEIKDVKINDDKQVLTPIKLDDKVLKLERKDDAVIKLEEPVIKLEKTVIKVEEPVIKKETPVLKKEELIIPKEQLLESKNGLLPKLSKPLKAIEVIEEEEEEEEVSEDEIQLKIDAIRENISLILSESNALNIQLNDLIDMSLNSIHKNFDYNQEKMAEMEYVINRAKNIEDEDKESLLKDLEKIKQKQQEISTKFINVIEAVKDGYNQEYNNKIVDGYRNYEKVAVAYVKGDITKKEMKDAGENLTKSIASMNILPDESIMLGIENTLTMIQEDLTTLENNVKKAEDKKILKV